jgi:hypothetical protein
LAELTDPACLADTARFKHIDKTTLPAAAAAAAAAAARSAGHICG